MKREKIGKYQVIKKAGEGAFGIVHKVQHIDTGKTYAIKQIAKKKMTDQLMENLRREVKISYELNHKSLVKCFNTMESKNNYYIVFEYCSGGDLSNFLEKHQTLEIETALKLMLQIKDAYQYLLSQNILHRDIKLENILLKSPEKLEIKISDFGCSKIDPCGTTICGTPKYMALELLEGVKNYDYKVDLWSLGLCFWELLYGYKNFPFSLKSRNHLIKDIKKYSGENLRFPKVPKFPEEFYDFFKKILQVSPRLRMDCQEFSEHPIFKYTGNEPEFNKNNNVQKDDNIKDKNIQSTRDTGNENDSNKDNQNLDSHLFKVHRETYQQKITEVELIKETIDQMKVAIKPWGKDGSENAAKFLTNFQALSIILIKKAQLKNDQALNSIIKKKNSFKLEKFQEFLEYPNEYVEFKNDMVKLKESLKSLDKEMYQQIIKDCYKESFLEELNDVMYRNRADKATKSAFINQCWKFVYKNYKSIIEDYEMQYFEKILARTSIILKGKIMEKIEKFY